MSHLSPKVAEILAKIRERNSTPICDPNKNTNTNTNLNEEIGNLVTTNQYGHTITYNTKQMEFLSLATSGKSSILLGPAGTGKTTCTKGVISSILGTGNIPYMEIIHKHLPAYQIPGIICTSFTRRAVSNLRKAMPPELKHNCVTIHKLLEYGPVYYEIQDPETYEIKNTMRFEPARTSRNPLPPEIRLIIIDESSMVSVELYNQLISALPSPSKVQILFVGDIQQLPPVFDTSILGYKMLTLPVVELDEVYRQALDSPIISFATDIRKGITTPITEKITHETASGKLTIHPWKKRIDSDMAASTCAAFLKQSYDLDAYNPDTDIILIPYNKAFGTDEINKHIANHLARKHSRITYEIISGFTKLYLSVGDKILYEKEEATVISINRNGTYAGTSPQKESQHLNYWGHTIYKDEEFPPSDLDNEVIDDIDAILNSMSSVEERVKSASHVVTVQITETGEEVALDTASELNSISLSYAITVHKSQGSEWKKVFLFLHNSHNTMCQRELLYTAVTRAREELYVICEKDTFVKGVNSQKIKGTTLEEKSTYFRGKALNTTVTIL